MINLLIHLLIHLFIDLLIHSFIDLFIHLLIDSFSNLYILNVKFVSFFLFFEGEGLFSQSMWLTGGWIGKADNLFWIVCKQIWMPL